jgi:hypothetical protein
VHSRERYREQWLGELRDAPALGIRASEIALVAVLATRGVARRVRVAVELLTLASFARGNIHLGTSRAHFERLKAAMRDASERFIPVGACRTSSSAPPQPAPRTSSPPKNWLVISKKWMSVVPVRV